jgi:hypothetical protein
MAPRLARGYHDSLSVSRGPLVFSYAIGEDRVKLRTRGMTADWQVFPSSEWNYALSVQEEENAGALPVEEHSIGGSVFALAGTPVTIQAPARKVPDWRAVDGVADPVPQSPVLTQEAEETIRLVPYAAAKLRITAFPQAKV